MNEIAQLLQNGRTRLENSDFYGALEDFDAAVLQQPDSVEAIACLGSAHLALGQKDKAKNCFEHILEIDSDHLGAHRLLAGLELTGPDYRLLLPRIHASLTPACYLEIGVNKGQTFRLASPDTRAIGIDPDPRLDLTMLPENHKIVKDTSDSYFASRRIRSDFGGKAVEFALIDGMHLFEFALRDFINVERFSAPNAVILIHDSYPLNDVTARRERETRFWSGDVWKLIPCLKELRPELAIETLPCPPTGLTVIRDLEPSSRLLADNLEEITAQYGRLEYAGLGENKAIKLNLISMAETNSKPYLCGSIAGRTSENKLAP